MLADIDGDRNIDAICQHACEESKIEIVLNINSRRGKVSSLLVVSPALHLYKGEVVSHFLNIPRRLDPIKQIT